MATTHVLRATQTRAILVGCGLCRLWDLSDQASDDFQQHDGGNEYEGDDRDSCQECSDGPVLDRVRVVLFPFWRHAQDRRPPTFLSVARQLMTGQ